MQINIPVHVHLTNQVIDFLSGIKKKYVYLPEKSKRRKKRRQQPLQKKKIMMYS